MNWRSSQNFSNRGARACPGSAFALILPFYQAVKTLTTLIHYIRVLNFAPGGIYVSQTFLFVPSRFKIRGILFLSCLSFCHSIILSFHRSVWNLTLLITCTLEQWVLEPWVFARPFLWVPTVLPCEFWRVYLIKNLSKLRVKMKDKVILGIHFHHVWW